MSRLSDWVQYLAKIRVSGSGINHQIRSKGPDGRKRFGLGHVGDKPHMHALLHSYKYTQPI